MRQSVNFVLTPFQFRRVFLSSEKRYRPPTTSGLVNAKIPE